MRKLLNTLGVIALLTLYFVDCLASNRTTIVPKWILAQIEATKVATVNADFSEILADKRVHYVGFIGTNYQKLTIEIQQVYKANNLQYNVSGHSAVKGNKCSFTGKITIIENRVFTEPTYSIDDSMRGKFKRRGCTIARYKFNEKLTEKGSGIFSGYLLFFWFETNDRTIKYDDMDDYSDSYCNNLYSGTWQSHKTKKSKPCAWGQYRIPNSGDLDIGAGEFSVNPKYIQNGWINGNE